MKKLVLEKGKVILKDRKYKKLTEVTNKTAKITQRGPFIKYNPQVLKQAEYIRNMRVKKEPEIIYKPSIHDSKYGVCDECGEAFRDEKQRICEKCGTELLLNTEK